MFDNFNVNLRKNEGFPTCIPCIPIPEYSQSNAPLVNSRRRLRRISSGSHVLYTNLSLVNSRRRLRRRISSGSHVLYTNLNLVNSRRRLRRISSGSHVLYTNLSWINSRRRLRRRISSGSHVLYTNLNLVNSRRRLRRISSGSHVLYTNLNCLFLLTWSTGMFFNENKRKRLHNNRVQFPEDLVEAPTWPPFLCLGAPTWRSWRHVKTENLVNSRRRRRQGVQSLCICSLSPLFCGVLVAVVVVIYRKVPKEIP